MASCLSETSSTSDAEVNPTTTQNDHPHMPEKKDGKGQVEQKKHTHLHQPRTLIVELDLIGGLAAGAGTGASSSAVSETTPEPRVYCCHYCDRKFHSSQALGGHQNAHKSVRALAKHRNRVAPADDHRRPVQQHYSNMPLASSNYGPKSFGRSSLGIMAHSMVHKPPPVQMLYSHGDVIADDRKPTIAGGQWWAGVACHLNDGKEELLDLSLKL